MTTPTLGIQTPKPIAVTVGPNAIVNDYVVAYNRTTGERITAKIVGGKAFFDAANFALGWTVGDILELRYNGTYRGLTTVTLTAETSKLQTATITLTAESSTLPAISV